MILLRTLCLIVGLCALGLLFLGLLVAVAPYLPGLEEEFIETSGGISMEDFGHDRSTYSAMATTVGVLPWLALFLASLWAWTAAGRRERRQRKGLLLQLRESGEAAKAWLAAVATGAVRGSGEGEEFHRPPKGLLPRHARLLAAALQGQEATEAGNPVISSNAEKNERLLSWGCALVLALGSSCLLLLAVLAVLSNLVYEASSTPLNLRFARAAVGGLGCGWVTILLLSGAAAILHLHRDRWRWLRTLEQTQAETDYGIFHQAREAMQSAGTDAVLRPSQVELLLRTLGRRAVADR